jgi:uncharacterized protein (TIGR02118 family)
VAAASLSLANERADLDSSGYSLWETQMIKVITCINRKPGMAVEDFQAYWRGRHAEIVSQMPNIRRYVQSHCLLGGYRKGGLIYDGIAEVWADSIEALREMTNSDAYGAVQIDEENFIDRSNKPILLCEEHVIKDGAIAVDGLKNIEFVSRRPDLPVAEFQAYWRDHHGPLAAEIPVLRRYVQSHTRIGGYRADRPEPAWDGCAVTWFDSIDDMRASAKTEAFARTMADEPNFIQHAPEGGVPTIITKEHVIIE